MNGSRLSRAARAAAPVRNRRGVSLVETLVALALFSLVAATFGDFLVEQIRTTGRNSRYTTAYTLAAEQLERLRGREFADLTPTKVQQARGDVTFTIDTTIWNDRPAPNMKQAAVDVSWSEPGRGTINVYVHTVYTDVRR